MFVDYIMNGEGVGPVANLMGEMRYDPGLLRPYKDAHGRPCVTINTGQKRIDSKTGKVVPVYKKMAIRDLQNQGINSPVFNATSLRKEQWIQLDQAVIRAARQRLRAWTDLENTNSFGGFNAMAKMTLEYEAMSDPGEAQVDMDGLSDGRTDNPLFKLRSIPLPITHSDFWFSSRRLAISQQGTSPLDTTMAECAGRRIGEMIEQTLIGSVTGISYGTQSTGVTAHDGTSKVYGYTNHPARITKTNITVPTGSNPEVTVSEVLTMRSTMYTNKFYGPYMIYHSTDWDQWLDNDYARLGGSNANMTLRDRLRKIEGIADVRRLDYLTDTYTMIIVQMTPDVVRAINGMDITTVQWESQGGMRLNFKVMAIKVPQIRYDYNGVAAILHGTTA